jgi:hypothetical protein
MAQSKGKLHRIRLFGKMLFSALMVCCLTDVACSGGKPGMPAYDVALRRLDLIPAGTVIDKKAPKGWSHLIIKSYSRPGEGDTKQLTPVADRLSRFLFTAILANVKAENTTDGKRYKLAKVAVGIGMSFRGKDTVITPDTQQRLGAGLGLLARVVLRTAQEKLADVTVVARSPTMMVFDSPGYMVHDEQHKPIALRYAVLVDESSGRLDTLVWVLDRDERGGYSGTTGAMQWLPQNLTGDCILHVDAREFSLGQPTEKAFAMTGPPKGKKEIAIGDDWKPLSVRSRFTATMAAELEKKLRQTLAGATD